MASHKIVIGVLSAFLLVVAFYMIGPGFMKNPDVYLVDFSVSEDGKEMTLELGSMGSMGYTRGYKDNGGGVKPHYLDFYSAFGGLNGSIGAVQKVTLSLDEKNDTEVYFNRSDGGYELVLRKNDKTGIWEQPSK